MEEATSAQANPPFEPDWGQDVAAGVRTPSSAMSWLDSPVPSYETQHFLFSIGATGSTRVRHGSHIA